MALVLRSQIELRSWAEYVSTGPREAAAFLDEANIDIKELHQSKRPARPSQGRLVCRSRAPKDSVHLFEEVDTMPEKSAELVEGLILKPGSNGRRTYSLVAKRA